MGYESTLYIGELYGPEPEYRDDPSKPHDDGSGYAYLRDSNGNPVTTNRVLRYLSSFARIEMCKLGYDSAILKLVDDSRRSMPDYEVPYIFGTDGNTRIKEDCYGSRLIPVRLEALLRAVDSDLEREHYRRLYWLKALIEGVLAHYDSNDRCDLVALHYGH